MEDQRFQPGRQQILQRMIASIPCVQSALNFLMIAILSCHSYFKIVELFHTFKGFITYLPTFML